VSPGHDGGRPASRPRVNVNLAPTAGSSVVFAQHDIQGRQNNTCTHVPRVTAQHVVLPTILTGRWASTVALSPPGRGVVLDGMDCHMWTSDGIQNLAFRLAGRPYELVEVDTALAFWLTSGVDAVRGWAA
jgi:hypothetical protein